MAKTLKSSGTKNWGGSRPGAGRKPTAATTKLLKKNLSETAFAAYEATQRTPEARSWIYMPTVTPKQELTAYDRIELLRRSRWFYNNVGFAARAIDAPARYSLPLKPHAATRDREWNRFATQAFHDACGTAAFGVDVGGEVNFFEAQPFILRQVAIDGDIFWQKMLSRSGRGMFRLIGGECIGSTTYLPDLTQSKGWIDGVLPDKFGKAVAFNVIDAEDPKKSVIVSADDLNQVRRFYRRGYLRSPGWLARASNHLADISEILFYAKTSFKLNQQIAFVVTSPESQNIGLGSKRVTESMNDLGNVQVDTLYNTSGSVRLKPGEDIKSFRNETKNDNFEEFLNYLARDVAWGMGIAPELLWDITKAGGANTRYVLEDANYFFKECQAILREQFCRPFWTYWVWQEIEAGRLEHPGEDWWRVHFIGPKAPSTDIGRDGNLYLSLVNNGLLSRKRWFSMQGLDVDKEMADMIDEAAELKRKCAAAGIKVSDIIPPAPGSAQKEDLEPDQEESQGVQNHPVQHP